MIDTGLDALLNSHHDDASQVAGISRCTYLVEDDAQLRFLVAQTNHGLHKVIAKGAVEPRCADNHATLAELGDANLASQLGRTINAVGTRGVRLHIRSMLRTIKHVIGADLNHPTTTLRNSSSEIRRSNGVQRSAEFLVVLSLIDSRIGRTIHNTINLMLCYKLVDSQLVGNIQLLHIGVKPLVLRIFLLQQLHLISQLAITACNQYIHLQLDNLRFTIY